MFIDIIIIWLNIENQVKLMYIAARKIKNSGTKKNTGFFPSIKNERPVAFESLLERDYIYLLEFDSDVLCYKEQPITITYCHSNKNYKYTPDFLVQRKNRTQLIEIKPQSKLQKLLCDDLIIKKFNAATHFCKSNGYSEFKIITDKEIRSGNILNNIKYLFSYSRLDVPAYYKLKIRNELMIASPAQISQLLSEICENVSQISMYYSYILAMLYHHEIKTDLQNPINKTSTIKL
jgi:hypothetical protein